METKILWNYLIASRHLQVQQRPCSTQELQLRLVIQLLQNLLRLLLKLKS